MRPVLGAAQAKELDAASQERGVPADVLMERAGHALAREAVSIAGGAAGRRVVVVAGTGNNGGDGLVAARRLRGRGAGVSVLLVGDRSRLSPLAEANLGRIHDVPVWPFSSSTIERALDRADVAIDAIFGVGFRGSAEGDAAAAIAALNASPVPVVAADVPSGVDADLGAVRGPAVLATRTVTFGAPKTGIILFPGAAHAGEVAVADIGFPPDLIRSDVLLVDEATVRDLLPRRGTDAHKRTSGVVLVVAGSARMTGAPTLVARGAYRAGAGLVHLLAPAEALPAIQPVLPEATYGTLPPTPDDIDLEAFDAIVIGPGLTGDPEIAAFVRRLVAIAPKPVVLDADGLNAFAGNAGELAAAGTDLVLTPHTGEFARLFGMPVGEVLEDRIGIARKAAAETRATILLKGARSVIALPGGEVRINPTGSPALSTGGTGDVLAGAIGAYLARGGFAPEAATVGAYVHGLAGELLHEGALAGDVADALPVAIDRILR